MATESKPMIPLDVEEAQIIEGDLVVHRGKVYKVTGTSKGLIGWNLKLENFDGICSSVPSRSVHCLGEDLISPCYFDIPDAEKSKPKKKKGRKFDVGDFVRRRGVLGKVIKIHGNNHLQIEYMKSDHYQSHDGEHFRGKPTRCITTWYPGECTKEAKPESYAELMNLKDEAFGSSPRNPYDPCGYGSGGNGFGGSLGFGGNYSDKLDNWWSKHKTKPDPKPEPDDGVVTVGDLITEEAKRLANEERRDRILEDSGRKPKKKKKKETKKESKLKGRKGTW